MSGDVEPCDYNLWRGFAISPTPGFKKQRRLMQHIHRIVCRRDKRKFKYLMKWLAWSVQNSHRHAEVVVVLKSEAEGCGKSTVGFVMLEIFGPRHGLLVDNKEQLIGTFNAHLETSCFVLGEEVLWAGDVKTADLVKSRVTASLIPIEAKYRQQRQVPNRLHVMLTTNHDWAVAAGMNARRYFVCEVSDEVVQKRSWFERLYTDLKDQGSSQFLHLLLNLKLGDWHPREMPKTDELVEQQIMSAGSVEQWLFACTEVDDVAGAANVGLGRDVATQTLYEAYTVYTKTRGSRPESLTRFGRLMTELFGASRRLPACQSNKRPPGYSIPEFSRHSRCRAQALGNTRLTGMVGVRSNYPARCSPCPQCSCLLCQGCLRENEKKETGDLVLHGSPNFLKRNPATPRPRPMRAEAGRNRL